MHRNYRDRMMSARDPRFAKIAERLGYGRRDMTPARDEMADLRAEYERVVGKKPFMGWDAEKLKAKIAEAQKDSEAAEK